MSQMDVSFPPRSIAAHWHWYRNVFSHVPSTKEREIAAMVKAIHASVNLLAAGQKAVGAVTA